MAPDSTHSWVDLLAHLVNGRSDEDSTRKCSVRVLDTVYVPQGGDVNEPQWYFTTKSGTIARKKGDKSSLSAVFERFSKFSLANPNNSQRLIGVFVHGNGYRQYLNESNMQEMLSVNSSVLLQKGSHLQVYLRPFKGRDEVATCRVRKMPNGKVEFDCVSGTSSGNLTNITNPGVLDQMKRFTQEILDHIRECRSLQCDSARVDFIIDDNEHVWLSNIPQSSFSPMDATFLVNENNDNSNNVQLPSVISANEASHHAYFDDDAAKQIIGSADGSRPSSRSVRPGSSGGIKAGWGAHLLGGELIFRDNSNVFLCQRGPDDLPGLRAWSLVSLGGDNLQWSVEMSEYSLSQVLSPNPTVEAIRRQRSEQRHKEPVLMLMLIRLGEQILLGKDLTVVDESTFKRAWQQAYEQAQKNVASAGNESSALQGFGPGSEVVVCGNIHAICRKLDSLCKINFRPLASLGVTDGRRGKNAEKIAEAGKAESHQLQNRPSSEASGTRGMSRNARPNSSNRDNLHGADSEMPQPPMQMDNPFFRGPQEAGGEVDIIQAAVAAVSKKVPAKDKKVKSGKVSSKDKQSSFSRTGSGFDAAPNVEMIAKFAAEKERQQREMREKQEQARRQATLLAVTADDPLYDYENDVDALVDIPEKKKKSKKKRLDTRNPDEFQSEEARLLYLESLAAKPQQAYQQFQSQRQQQWEQFPGPLGYNPGASQVSMLSGSEADFMVRQAQFGDPTVALGLAAGDSGSLAGGGYTLGGGLDQGSVGSFGSVAQGAGGRVNQVEAALRDRVVILEKEIVQLKQQTDRRDQQIDDLGERLRRANNDVAGARRTLALESKRLQDAHEEELIRLREQHALQMAAATGSSKFDSQSGPAPIVPAIEGNRQLMEQLESLRNEIRRQQIKFTDERQMLLAEGSGKMLAQERHFKEELSDLKRRLAAAEDAHHFISEEARTSHSRVTSLEQLCRTLEIGKAEAVDAQNKLRADLKNMQASVNASYRLESAQNLTVGVDADTQIRLNEAKSEASKRQLLNKVDFLKAQLAAEQASGEELRKTVDGHRAKIDEMRDEFRLRAQEIERSKQAAIEDAERRIEAQYEGRMNELTTLQAKMQLMQGQLQDAFSDGSLLKQREEAAKAAAAKAQSAQSMLRAEIDQLRQQVMEAREEKDKLEIASGSKQNNDAIIRRLDNERQYLKSQLASEITHKNEMQSALAKCQHQLNDVQKQWKSDVDALKETKIIAEQDASAREQMLKQKALTLESENSRLDGANRDLKEAFVKMREQVRMEQLNMENALSVNRRLQEQYDLTKAEVNRLQEAEEQTANEHSEQLRALNQTIQDVEDRRASDLAKLKKDLSDQYLTNSETQKEYLGAKREVQFERELGQRKAGALAVVNGLRRWRLNRLANALRTWNTASTLVGVAAQFREHVNDLISDTISEQKREKDVELSDQRNDLLRQQQQSLLALETELNARQELALVEADERHQAVVEDIHNDYHRQLEEQNARMAQHVQEVRAEGERDLARLHGSSDVHMKEFAARCKADLDSALDDAKRRINDANTQKELADQMITRLKTQLHEFEDMHNKSLVELMAEHTVAVRAKEKEAALEAASMQERHTAALKSALAKQEQDFFGEMETMRSRMKAQQLESEEKLKEVYEDAQEAMLAKVAKDTEDRLRLLRSEWEIEAQAQLAKRDAAHEELVTEKMEAYAKSVEAERQRAVKLEGSKWRQALKDAEHRFDLEISKAKAEGRAEAKKESRDNEAVSVRNHELDILRLTEEHSKKISSLVQEHATELAREMQAQESLRLDAIKKVEETTKAALDQSYAERLAQAVDDTWKDANGLWGKKLAKQEERLESFKKEVAAQTQQLAMERNSLQQKVNQSEDIVKRMEQLNKAEIAQLVKDHDAEKNLMNLKFEKAKKVAIKDLAQEQQETLDGVEQKYKEIADRRVQLERTKLEEDMNKQISQLQVESEGLISGLESAVAELKDEKERLTSDLATTSTKLEDTEDSLYDLQQSSKKAQKDASITLWRQVVSQQRMKQRFESHIDDMEKDFEERERLLERDMMNEQNEMVLAALKLAELLTELESMRQRTHKILTNYRTDELLEKRTQIRVLEKDFERLTMEKDALEEQRDVMEEEIEDLEGQVREMEEQIREHNRTSSMQNGRINVAHARKKRRLDSELERMLESIEQKRIGMQEMDEKSADKARERDSKEQEMVDLEKQVVGILVEQQRKVLQRIEEMKGASLDKCRLVMSVARLPWPPPEAPTIEMVTEMQNKKSAIQQTAKASQKKSEEDD